MNRADINFFNNQNNIEKYLLQGFKFSKNELILMKKNIDCINLLQYCMF